MVQRLGVGRVEAHLPHTFEMADFGASLTPEAREAEEGMRAKVAAKN